MANRPDGYRIAGFFVGDVAYLDSVGDRVGRYWRAIELGSTYWDGKQVAGLWGPSAEPRGGLWSTATSVFETDGGGQKFIPFFSHAGADMQSAARKAYWWYVREQGYKDPRVNHHGVEGHTGSYANVLSGPTLATIKKPIPAGHFFTKAAEEFDMRAQEVQALREAFAFTGRNSAADINKAISRGPEGPKPKLTGGQITSKATLGKAVGEVRMLYTLSGPTQRLSRNALGQFRTYQAELNRINRILAVRLQDIVVRIAEEYVAEHGRPTEGHLVEALKSPQNRWPA